MQRKHRLICYSVLVLSLYGFFDSSSAHSQMICAKYNTATGACSAAIRDEGVAFLQESHQPANGGLCQSPWANPITSYYSNGASCPDWAPCPDAMGTYSKGETFTIMWYARNHAVENQSPATVFLYLSPVETANQGSDVSQSTFESKLLCSGPYMNCGGQNGNTVPCTLTCTMPNNVANGIYTLFWKWPWQGVVYTTCADINIVSSSGSNPPPAPLTTSKATPVTTSKANAVTTSKVNAVTTSRSNTPVTTSRSNTPVTTSRSNTPVTTSRIPSTVTTGSVAPPSGGGDGNCAGLSELSISQATIISVETWGSGSSSQFRAVVNLNVRESVLSNWRLEVIFPSNQVQATLISALNGGKLLCQNSSPFAHAVVQPNTWTQSVSSGTIITIELLGTNKANLNQQSILANTILKVYKS